MKHLSDETLQLLADGMLEAAPRVEAEAHLGCCEICRDGLDAYRMVFDELEALPTPPPPPMRFTAQVMARIDEREALLARQRRLALGTLLGSAVMAVVCFLLAGNGAWARQLSHLFTTALELSRMGRIAAGVLGPVMAAWRLELLALCAAICVPTLMALHRTIAPRPVPVTN